LIFTSESIRQGCSKDLNANMADQILWSLNLAAVHGSIQEARAPPSTKPANHFRYMYITAVCPLIISGSP
jgi:hypothetical protein